MIAVAVDILIFTLVFTDVVIALAVHNGIVIVTLVGDVVAVSAMCCCACYRLHGSDCYYCVNVL